MKGRGQEAWQVGVSAVGGATWQWHWAGQYPRMLQQGISTYHRLHTSSFTIDAILGLPQSAIDYSTNSSGDKEKCDRSRKSKCKRVRTIFTAEQLERLEAEFERQQYMVGPERLYLAHALRLTEAQVKVWFQNRRIKWRKQHLELEQQRLAAMKRHRELSEASTESEEERTTQCENYSSTEVKQCPTHQ